MRYVHSIIVRPILRLDWSGAARSWVRRLDPARAGALCRGQRYWHPYLLDNVRKASSARAHGPGDAAALQALRQGLEVPVQPLHRRVPSSVSRGVLILSK